MVFFSWRQSTVSLFFFHTNKQMKNTPEQPIVNAKTEKKITNGITDRKKTNEEKRECVSDPDGAHSVKDTLFVPVLLFLFYSYILLNDVYLPAES